MHHAYRPHSHRTWTIAVVQRGAARFTVESSRQRANAGELFVLEPEAVHTGMAAVPEGWAYKVLYVEPSVLHDWAQHDGPGPGAARWVVFRDHALQAALLRAHAALALETPGLAVDETVLEAIAGLTPHLRGASVTGPARRRRERGEHAAVRRARVHLQERWAEPVSLAELAGVAGLSRFELIRRFREQNGLTPHAFQRDLRIDRARSMLGEACRQRRWRPSAGLPTSRICPGCSSNWSGSRPGRTRGPCVAEPALAAKDRNIVQDGGARPRR